MDLIVQQINDSGSKKISVYKGFTQFRDGFSTIAIKKAEEVAFTITLFITDKNTYDSIKQNLQNGADGVVEIIVKVVTFTNIESTYKCRVHLDPESGEVGELVFDRNNAPMTFVYEESRLLKKEELIVLGFNERT